VVVRSITDITASKHRSHVRLRRPSGEPPPIPKELDRVAIAWLIGFAFWAAIWAWVMLADAPAIWITERDLDVVKPIAGNRVGWLTTMAEWTNRWFLTWGTFAIGWITIIGGLVAKRVRHVLLFIASLSIAAAVATVVGRVIGRPRPLGVDILGEWEAYAQPSRPMTLLTAALMAAGLTLVVGGKPRRRWLVAMSLVVLWVGFAQVYLAVEHPTDGFAGATVAVAIVLLLFRTGAPEKVFPIAYGGGKTAHLDVTGARGLAIRKALQRQLGVEITDIQPVGLEGSAGSTPLRIQQSEGPELFAKLYARSHLRSDRSYKLSRTLMYGRLEDEQHFTSVRRLIQHEDYMLHVMRAAKVDTMKPAGIVEITPDREYLLVSEFLDGAKEISDVEVTVELIDQGLETVNLMWQAGLAHRDIKPANIMVQDGQLRLIDVAFGQVRPSPWRQAVDLANMMLVLALGSSPQLVYDRAKKWFTEDEIAEAFAAARGVTLPSALRADVRRDGRRLLETFREIAPDHDQVAIQRWSFRRIALTGWVAVVGVLVFAIFIGNLRDIGLWP